jgi:hypothetical protein
MNPRLGCALRIAADNPSPEKGAVYDTTDIIHAKN